MSDASYSWIAEIAIVPRSRGIENPGYLELTDKSVGLNALWLVVDLNMLNNYIIVLVKLFKDLKFIFEKSKNQKNGLLHCNIRTSFMQVA